MKIAVTGKGGVGKTTFASILARLYAEEGKSVLAVDVDPDANLGLALGFSEEEYCDCVKKQFDAMAPLYEIDAVMHRLLTWNNRGHASILGRWERMAIRLGRWAYRKKEAVKACSPRRCLESLKRHPRLFRLVHRAGITALRIPVLITGKMRAYGWICDSNTAALRAYQNSHLGERPFAGGFGENQARVDLWVQ